MPSKFRLVAFLIALVAAIALVGCQSAHPKAQAPQPASAQPTPTAVPTPAMEEEVVPDLGGETVVSEHATSEDLPADLVSLNAHGYLADVFFDTDSYTISAEGRENLAKNATWLNDYPSIQILIEGHCDERNTREYNLALGERRAASVRDYLVFLGIAPDRIRTVSYGEERPFAVGHNEAAWSQNRRAHFVITAR